MELRSLTLCWADQLQSYGTNTRLALRRINSRCLSRAAGCCRVGSFAVVVPSERLALRGLGLSRLALQRGARFVHQRRYHC
jgi:hypothetical protein